MEPTLCALLTMQAYLAKASTEVVSGGHLVAVLGVFQKLLASRVRACYYTFRHAHMRVHLCAYFLYLRAPCIQGACMLLHFWVRTHARVSVCILFILASSLHPGS
jgi:hypothetical protein